MHKQIVIPKFLKEKLYSNEQNCKQFDDEPYTSWFGDETISEIVGLKYTELVDSKMHQILTNEEDNKIGIKGTYDYLLKNMNVIRILFDHEF